MAVVTFKPEMADNLIPDIAVETLAWGGVLGGTEVVTSRLGEAVIVRLTEAILEGKLKPGDALPSEGRIAAAFGVSKPIAREALRDLATMGVVQVAQGRISRVRAIDAAPLARFFRFAVGSTAKGIREAVELRRMLEPQIALYAARRRDQADIAAIETILVRMEAALGDVLRWIEADLALHSQMALATHNNLVNFQMQGLEPIVREMMGQFNARGSRTPQDWRVLMDRHALVARTIIAGDEQGAARAMQAHFAAADDAIGEIYGADAQPPDLQLPTVVVSAK